MNRFGALIAIGGLILVSCAGDDSSDPGSASPEVASEEVDEAMLALIRQSARRVGGAALTCSPGHRERVAAFIEDSPAAARAAGQYEADWWGLDDAPLDDEVLERPSDLSEETWAAVLFFVDEPAAFDRERFVDLFLEHELSRCD